MKPVCFEFHSAVFTLPDHISQPSHWWKVDKIQTQDAGKQSPQIMSQPELEISLSDPCRSEGKCTEIVVRCVLVTALYVKEGCVFPKSESGEKTSRLSRRTETNEVWEH